MIHSVFIGIGSNVGDRDKHIRDAVRLLSENFTFVRMSSIYETAAMYNTEQPAFLNAVLSVRTKLLPLDVLNILLDVERKLGRVRTVKNAPRTIDLDILLYDDLVVDLPELKIPHPLMCERRFVLEPLAEIAPGIVHPIVNASILTLCKSLKEQPIILYNRSL